MDMCYLFAGYLIRLRPNSAQKWILNTITLIDQRKDSKRFVKWYSAKTMRKSNYFQVGESNQTSISQ